MPFNITRSVNQTAHSKNDKHHYLLLIMFASHATLVQPNAGVMNVMNYQIYRP